MINRLALKNKMNDTKNHQEKLSSYQKASQMMRGKTKNRQAWRFRYQIKCNWVKCDLLLEFQFGFGHFLLLCIKLHRLAYRNFAHYPNH